jgi:hypothetical protein
MSQGNNTGTLSFSEVLNVGDNRRYLFAVGKLADRWAGFAVGKPRPGKPDEPRMIFIFPEISDDYTLGIESRDEAIRMTAAIAQDPESNYGGIKRWFVEDALRASPDDYRCEHCQRVGCKGIECVDALEDLDVP